jgi:hypothetical protein
MGSPRRPRGRRGRSRLPLAPDYRRRFHGRNLVERLEAARREIAPRVPDIDSHDLLLILEAMLRPPGSGRRLFVVEIRPGVYVP